MAGPVWCPGVATVIECCLNKSATYPAPPRTVAAFGGLPPNPLAAYAGIRRAAAARISLPENAESSALAFARAGPPGGPGRGGGSTEDQGQQGWRQALSESRLRIDDRPSFVVVAQNRVVARSYSAWNTGLPAFTKVASPPHSPYPAHSSLTAKSNAGASAVTWSRSFFNPTASPRLCA